MSTIVIFRFDNHSQLFQFSAFLTRDCGYKPVKGLNIHNQYFSQTKFRVIEFDPDQRLIRTFYPDHPDPTFDFS